MFHISDVINFSFFVVVQVIFIEKVATWVDLTLDFNLSIVKRIRKNVKSKVVKYLCLENNTLTQYYEKRLGFELGQ